MGTFKMSLAWHRNNQLLSINHQSTNRGVKVQITNCESNQCSTFVGLGASKKYCE